MSYESAARFAQDGGLIYFGLMFLAVLVYVFWPRNKKGFDEAARLPLEEDDER